MKNTLLILIVLVLIGDKIENNSIMYLIREKHQTDIDPVYISYLHIELDSNKIATKCRIEK